MTIACVNDPMLIEKIATHVDVYPGKRYQAAVVPGAAQTVRADGLELYEYRRHGLTHISGADTAEHIKALLPCNAARAAPRRLLLS